MSIRVALHHRTSYKYDRMVGLSPHIVRLRPAPHCAASVRSYALHVQPKEHFINWQQDPHGNFLARFVFNKPTRQLSFDVDIVADIKVVNPFDFFLEDDAEQYPFVYDNEVRKDLAPFLQRSVPGPRLQAYLRKLPKSRKRTADFLVELNQHVQQDVRYVVRMEPGVQSCEETLAKRSGSCRDSALLLMTLLRHMGLASRFVSGYLIQLVADEKPLDGPAGPTEDFTDLHAWTEVYLPGAGWVGLDPTSGLLTGEGHIPLAATPEPSAAAPISGATGMAEVEFDFEMSVRRIQEAPRVTKPFTPEQWASIDTLGNQVETSLQANDVRLMQGGEPTFVSLDDRESAQWHIAAQGPEKRVLAKNLYERLCARFADGALHHIGQGKWYPGESLPRWSFDCFWLRDGSPLWRDPQWRGDPSGAYGHGTPEAERFTHALAQRLGIETARAVPGYEDVFYYLWREQRLPLNTDPFDAKLEEEEDRVRLMKIYEQGLAKVVGYALPVRGWLDEGTWKWETAKWGFRGGRMYLIPGDSPMGYRMPLDRLFWEAEDKRDTVVARDPSRFPAGFAAFPWYKEKPDMQKPGDPTAWRPYEPDPARGDATMTHAPTGLVRTAFCIEARQGRLHVFMPPADTAEAYFELLRAVEDTASRTKLPVIVEGYHPPHDPRVQHFSIQPDPGVVEVNVHPAANWKELKQITTTLFEEARLSRLSSEKYSVDGRAVGTGGGCHIVVGGPTAADSPFLRRPELLKSLTCFWHNHPSFSYLFSGLFIGPTCQAPRMDEARNDMVPELELAFARLQGPLEATPWRVDRALRNIFVDVTGNTHRAEFCLDKLYSPDSAGGRRGLVEMRAFEMAPNANMSLLQQLLVRTAVAAFWEKPYEAPLTRWNTLLHDRFLLPRFIEADFKAGLRELAERGYRFDPEWFAAQFQFRFPPYGDVAFDGTTIDIRGALEPWHVLGEHPGAGGTARNVDHSLERIQVRLQGATPGRHGVTCNGYSVPLQPTGVAGEYCAGVRFKAYTLPNSLHAEIPEHAPLVFDLVDLWNERSIGGCTYWPAHPGGLNPDTYPVNANEAESRRYARFSPMGHTPGRLIPRPAVCAPEYPMTLDLRRAAPLDPSSA